VQNDVALLEPYKNIESTYGTYGILGNHDMVVYPKRLQDKNTNLQKSITSLAQALNKLNITILRQELTTLTIGDTAIEVAGIDDIVVGRGDAETALQNSKPEIPTLLLTHNPSVIRNQVVQQKVDLVLAGHTHGGQIALPFIGPLSSLPTSIGQKYDQGVFQWNDTTQLAITRGLGETLLRARFWVPPEIMVLNLIPESSE
jgi:predicted MPP superfamily phosphohydrolase